MPGIPVFEIGVWNAWIFMSYLLLSFVFFTYVALRHDAPSQKDIGLSKSGMTLASSSKLILLPVLIYSIFLPLKLGTLWFSIGLPITLIGLIAYTVVLVNWANTPHDEPVSRGLYRYSRHPMYVTMFVFFIGLGIATASWIILLCAVLLMAGCVAFAKAEEQGCISKYGNTYREYMNKTPRWIGLPKP
jgi:protein-S-isoprenylcysteine O-methyltransferase Ste14